MALYQATYPDLFTQGDAAENAIETADTGTLVEESVAQKVPMSIAPLTWGVELEFVFAFHENQLDLGEQDDNDGVPQPDLIQKNIPYKVRRDAPGFKNPIPADILPDRVYNSWGFYNKAAIQNPRHYDNHDVEKILDSVLDEKCASISHRLDDSIPINMKTKVMYDQWLIIRDHSVCGVGSKNIPTWLPRVTSKTDWDSYGLELVSPIFSTDSEKGINEITQVLDVVKGTDSDPTGAFITNQCGLHVHVQAPESLDVLKELALLCVVYEGEISKLHPHCRRPQNLNARYILESNRLFFLYRHLDHSSQKTHGDLDVSNEALARQDENFLDEIKSEIWRCTDAGELALKMNWPNHGDGNELGNRNRQVNFTAAARYSGAPCTIEFRQARGTLDAKDVRMWVDFCIGLVRLAQFYVDNPGTFPMKTFKDFLVDGEQEDVRERFYIMDLMKDMGMSEEDRNYWRERKARFMGRGGPLDRLDNERAPVHENSQGEGIPGGDGSDEPRYDPDEAPSGGGKDGDDTSGGDTGNIGGNSGNSGSDPPPNGNGEKKDPPKTRGKRPAQSDDEEEEDDDWEKGPVAKKKKAGSQDESEDGKNGDPKAGSKRPADDDSDDQDENKPKKQKRSPRTTAKILASFSNDIINAARILAAAAAQAVTAQAPVVAPDYDNPTPDMVAPVGILSPDEAHVFTGSVWRVRNFDVRDWLVQHTSIFIGGRSYVCAVNALLAAMRNQYPNDPAGEITAEALLQMFDNLVGRQVYNDALDDELAELMRRWTGGRYHLVIVSDAYNHDIAYRSGDLQAQRRFGRNLYVRHKHDAKGGGGHWESMRKESGPLG